MSVVTKVGLMCYKTVIEFNVLEMKLKKKNLYQSKKYDEK